MSSCTTHFSNLVRNPVLADFEQNALRDSDYKFARSTTIHVKCHSEHWTTSRKITGVVLAVIALLLMVGGGTLFGTFGSFVSGVGGLVLIVDLAMLYYYRRMHAGYENSVASQLKRDFYNKQNKWTYNFENLLTTVLRYVESKRVCRYGIGCQSHFKPLNIEMKIITISIFIRKRVFYSLIIRELKSKRQKLRTLARWSRTLLLICFA